MKRSVLTVGVIGTLVSAAIAASASAPRQAPVAAVSVALPPPLPAPMVPPAVDLDAGRPPPAADAAPVALLLDLSSGRTLYARDPDRRFLPASVTKVMTAYTAFDLLAQGKLKAGQLMSVSDDAWNAWHAKGSRMFLPRAGRVSVDELLMGITTVSANDGCIVLAEGAVGSVAGWVTLMNAEARKLGMNDSHFGTPNGWMDNGNTYYTAHDLARLADAMLTRYPAYYHRYIGHKSLRFNNVTQFNHDPTLGIVPGADGIKTGFTDEAHYTFLGSAERAGRRLVMVLAAVPTAPARAQAARALLEWGFAAFDSYPLFGAGAQVGTADVQQGAAASVGLMAPRAYFATLPKGSRAPISLRVKYAGPLVAPIVPGTAVAQLEIRVGSAVSTVPLVAGNGVARGTALDRLRAGLAALL